ncbi:MAG TPA: ABC transporter permease subunit [Collimonas sp.]|nr:ABC transporter permease subunit [Collimonas sp.]
MLPGPDLIGNLQAVAQRSDIGRQLFNSLMVASAVVIGKLLLSAITAFAVVYFRSPFKPLIFWTVFATLLMPLEVRIIPTYAVASNLFEPLQTILQLTGLDEFVANVAGIKITSSLNLLDTYAGLSLPLIASATGTFLFLQFYQTIPVELAEAALVDGTGPLRFFFDILLPLSKTNFAALGTIAFISTWKDYMWPLVITSQEHMRTVTLGMASFLPAESGQWPEWNLLMAAALLAVIPPGIFILLAQRWFVKAVVDIEK